MIIDLQFLPAKKLTEKYPFKQFSFCKEAKKFSSYIFSYVQQYQFKHQNLVQCLYKTRIDIVVNTGNMWISKKLQNSKYHPRYMENMCLFLSALWNVKIRIIIYPRDLPYDNGVNSHNFSHKNKKN